MLAKILEVSMLVLFGISWPISLIKSIKSKSTKGKSIIFLFLIDFGYICGMTSKIVSTTFIWSTDWWIFAIYAINFSFVTADLIVYLLNNSRNKKEAESKALVS